MLRRMFLSLSAVLALLVASFVAAPVASTATAASSYTSPCHNWKGWTTGAENSYTMSSDLVNAFRAGRHTGCDRLVFALDGKAKVGYYAGYGAIYQPSGKRVTVAGPVDFQVVIRAWPKGWDTAKVSDDFAVKANQVIYSTANPKGLTRVEQVKTAGAFEGETVFAVGLDKKVPMRLFDTLVKDGKKTVRVVVIEFAHKR